MNDAKNPPAFTIAWPTWVDPDQKVKIRDALDRLDAATGTDPSTRLVGVTKEVAKLNAIVAETSSNATLAAAQVVADALDRSTAAADRSGDRLWWLTLSYVAFTAVLALIAGL